MDAHRVLLELYQLITTKSQFIAPEYQLILLGSGLTAFLIGVVSCCSGDNYDKVDNEPDYRSIDIRRLDHDLSELAVACSQSTSQIEQLKKDVKILLNNYKQIVDFLKTE